MKEILKWEFPTEDKSFESGKKIDIRINDKVILSEDSKQFIDYLSESIVEKNSKAIFKRNIYSQTVNVIYKLGVVIVIMKFFPEILSLFFETKGAE